MELQRLRVVVDASGKWRRVFLPDGAQILNVNQIIVTHAAGPLPTVELTLINTSVDEIEKLPLEPLD